MCATFNIDESTLNRYLDGVEGIPTMRSGGDVFPSDIALVIGRRPTLCRWGFKPFNNKGVIFNARAETVTQRQMFAQSFLTNRCVVPACGFYEWDRQKKKHYFVSADSKPLFLCGFYRRDNDGDRFIILTKQSTYPVSDIHDRIPVIARQSQADDYIQNKNYALDFVQSDADIKLSMLN